MNPKNFFLTPAQIKEELLKHTFLDPRYDATFKLLLMDGEHPERLVHFLNALLRLTENDRIESAVLQVAEQEVIFGFERKVVFDLHCRNEKGEPIIVELQRAGDDSFKDRMLYYAAIAIKKEVLAGADNYRLPRLYLLALMNFDFEEHPEHHHHTVRLVNIEHGGVFYDKLCFVFIELQKFKKREDELCNDEDRWLFAMNHLGDLDQKPKTLDDPIFEALFESARIAKLDSMKIDQLSHKLADEGIRNGEMAFANRKGLEQGREEGLEQGRVEGLERGRVEGLELAAHRIAKALKDKGIPFEVIAETTGLGASEIKEL